MYSAKQHETPPRVTVVVACRNEAASIQAFLDSLLGQDAPDFAWEAVIADGMSQDGTRHLLEEWARRDRRLRVIDNPGKFVSPGLNAAVAAARGEIIIRMDAHTEYAPDYIRQCVAALEASGADNVGGPARTRADGMVARAIAAAYHSRFSCGGPRFHDDRYEGYVDTVAYGCWRKDTLLQLGLFDETLVRNQDDELNLRLVRCGGRLWQTPRIRSWYRPRSSLRRLFGQYFQYGFWKVAVIRKHRIPASWRHLVPGAFVLGNFLMPVLLAAAWLLNAKPLLEALAAAWLLALALYGLAALAAAFTAAQRRGWELLLILPGVFAIYHVAYGAGFLAGLAHHLGGGKARPRLASLMSGVTH